MKKELIASFLRAPQRRMSLMGMSGVGKTYLSKLMPRHEWFHYSVDYRIGTRYLNEEINDFLKIEAMTNPLLAKLLRSDAIHIQSNLSFDNLDPLSIYLGMVGNLDKGGLSLEEFIERLDKHREAEINATYDAIDFMNKTKKIYGYPHFICDTSGSFCELDAPKLWEKLSKHSLLIYIRATPEMQSKLIDRSQTHPKPLYYQAGFLLEMVGQFCKKMAINSWREIDPVEFAKWVFPNLVEHRLRLYQQLADQYGITLCASKIQGLTCADNLFTLIETKSE